MNRLLVYLGGLTVLASGVLGAFMADKDVQPMSQLQPQETNHFSFIRPLDVPQAPALPPHAQQAWVPDSGMRKLFDHHLVLGAGRPIAEVRQVIEANLDAHWPADEAARGKALLAKYLRYSEAMAPLQEAMDLADSPAALRTHIDALQALRMRVFTSDEVAALFPAEAAYEQTLLARMELRHHPALSEEQKHQRLQELEAAVPPAVQAAEEARSQVVRLEQVPVEQAGSEGEEGIFRLRAP